jgi:hypothetical protein
MVLPSVSNLGEHPENRPDDYTVVLGSKVTLNGDWEAALLNIHYPHNWFDFREKSVVHWIYSKTRIPLNDTQVAADVAVRYDAHFKTCTVSLAPEDASRYPDHRLTSVVLWPNHYSTVQEIGDRMCKLIEDGIKQSDLKVSPKVLFQYDSQMRTGTVYTTEGSLFLFAESTYAGDILGLNSVEIAPRRTDPVSTIEMPKLYMLSGTKQSTFSKLDSIYVYTDIVEFQHVGDELSPLLGVVPVQKRTQESQFFTFNPPLYLPVSKKEFTQVNIKLKTTKGKPLPFPHFTAGVTCTLRFRKRKNNF